MSDPLNVIIDISHHNGNPDFQQAAAAGILGVIHKVTQGLSFKDSMYQINRQKALDAGCSVALIISAPAQTARRRRTSFYKSLILGPILCLCSTTSPTLKARR